MARKPATVQGLAYTLDLYPDGADHDPAVAWLAYGIHGNESYTSDAAMAVMHHLAADRSVATTQMLRELVVIVDPNQNPDGRERFIAGVAQTRGVQANVDDQSLVHTGNWPFGRGNHYLFDLNRDWIYAPDRYAYWLAAGAGEQLTVLFGRAPVRLP